MQLLPASINAPRVYTHRRASLRTSHGTVSVAAETREADEKPQHADVLGISQQAQRFDRNQRDDGRAGEGLEGIEHRQRPGARRLETLQPEWPSDVHCSVERFQGVAQCEVSGAKPTRAKGARHYVHAELRRRASPPRPFDSRLRCRYVPAFLVECRSSKNGGGRITACSGREVEKAMDDLSDVLPESTDATFRRVARMPPQPPRATNSAAAASTVMNSAPSRATVSMSCSSTSIRWPRPMTAGWKV